MVDNRRGYELMALRIFEPCRRYNTMRKKSGFDSLRYGVVYFTVSRKLHLRLGRMDVYIHHIGVNFDENRGYWIAALVCKTPECGLKSVSDEAASNRTMINKEQLVRPSRSC